MNNKVLGFSCVENHVIEFLKKRCNNTGLLYYDCFMPIDKIYASAQQESFEFFSGIKRIQNVLKENGLLEIDLYQNSFEDFKKNIRSADENTQILMLVGAANTQRLFFARGLREDHYVDIRFSEEKYVLTNDIPPKTIEMSVDDIHNIYMGNYLEIKYEKFYNDNQFISLSAQRQFSQDELSRSISITVTEDENFLIIFRNALVIIKTLRERLCEYLTACGKDIDISEDIKEIGKLMALAEYLHIRKTSDKHRFADMIRRLNQIDERIFQKVEDI